MKYNKELFWSGIAGIGVGYFTAAVSVSSQGKDFGRIIFVYGLFAAIFAICKWFGKNFL